MKTLLQLAFLAAFALTLSSCKDISIVHQLDERDANEILVVLARHDIMAKKEHVEKNQEVKWTVTVKPADEMNARQVLVANNLPKVRLGGLEGICKDAGLILTPKTEKCREILAYKGEIINSLESIPGVVSADVVLNIPDKEEFPDENAPTPRPTAAVTVQYLKDGQTGSLLTEGQVQQFVSNSVNGLDPRDVAVIISYLDSGIPIGMDKGGQTTHGMDGKMLSTSDTSTATADAKAAAVAADIAPTTPEGDSSEIADLSTVGGLKMDAASAKKFKVVAVLFLVLFLLLTVSFIFVLLRLSRVKKQVAVSATLEEGDEAGQKLLKA